MKPFFISTPIYYVNAKPHLGHAYTTTIADALARFKRAAGYDTFFLTGTDEHGDKIQEAADKAGIEPQAYADQISGLFRDLWPHLGISNDDFIRTTEDRHKACVQRVLQQVYDADDIYFGDYGGHYCTGCERFLTDKELEEGKCPDHQVEPRYIQEKNYFFRMSKYQDWLIDHIKANPDFIRPERYRNEVLSILESGALEDLCISRPKSRLSWGIELPFDTEYVCYVWFDALLNYVAALNYPDGEHFARYWPGAQHFIAKDILKPHAIFWPTMLKAAGIPVYNHLNVHGYWLVKETKMSKSLGNVVEPLDMAEKYGLGPFRYFLLREMQFGADASFSEEALVGRLNADLANDLGNLFNRVLSMCKKYFRGVVPEGRSADVQAEMDMARDAIENYMVLFGSCRFARGLEALWTMIRACNKYIDEQAPWALKKQGEEARLAEVMYVVLECMRKAACCLTPVMPELAAKMLEQLGWDPDAVDLNAELAEWGRLEPGVKLAAKSNLFPRVELEEPAPEPKPQPKQKKQRKAEEPAPGAEFIEFGDFQKVAMRVGTVLGCERHPDADKLLVLKVDLGEDTPRTIVSGLAEHYAPDEIVGRQVIVVANLAPRKLRGVESQGMILTAESDGRLALLTTLAEAAPGAEVR